MSTAPADWYPDPNDPSQLRYWDGLRWTEHRSPNPAWRSPTPVPAPVSEPRHAAPVQVSQPAQTTTGREIHAEAAATKIPLFGARGAARQHADEAARLRGELERLGALDVAELSAVREQLHYEVAAMRQHMADERHRLEAELAELGQRVVVTREEEVLQEVGVYQYHHPLED